MSIASMLLFAIVEGFVARIVRIESHWEYEIILEDWSIVGDTVSIIFSVRIIVVREEPIVLMGVVEAALGGAGTSSEAIICHLRVFWSEETCVSHGV